MDKQVSIEVAYAAEDKHLIVPLTIDVMTIEQAIQHSNILEQFPEIDLAINKVGIFGELRTLDEMVAEGDRIEIYRPLKIDPKQARRNRAKK